MAASVLQGTSLLIALQFLSRAITFIANQLLLRFLTAQLLGVATHLEVYYLSVLFFARESLRVAIQRQGDVGDNNEGDSQTKWSDDTQSPKLAGQSKTDEGKPSSYSSGSAASAATQAIINLGYLAPFLGAPIAFLLGAAYTKNLSPDTLAATPYLSASLNIYAIAALLELLSEPAFVLTQSRLQFAARARAEGLATLAKCAVTLTAAVWAARGGVQLGALPFALGQMAFGVVLLGVYVHAAGSLEVVIPRRIGGGGYVMECFYAPTLKLAATMWGQGLVKYFLTQGDSLLMGVLVGVDVQGVYALANNYGSLAARLVFQPVEESSRNYFSRLLSAGDVAEDEKKAVVDSSSDNLNENKKSDGMKARDDKNDSKQSSAALTTASTTLTRLLRIYTLLTLPLLALGPPAAPLLLTLVAGSHWTAAGAGAALAAYIYYIPLLALNGLLEAFVASVASERDVVAQSAWMAGFFAAFAGCAWVSLGVWGMGATGIVGANGVNMALRIVWAVVYSRRWFADRGGQWDVRGALPGSGAVAAAAVAAQVVRRVVVSGEDVVVTGVRDVLWELGKIAGVGVPFVLVL